MELIPMFRMSILLLLALTPTLAFADPQAAMSCAAQLQPGAKAVFDGTIAGVRSGTQAKEALKATRASLIQSGTITQASAQSDVQSAVACLKLLKKQ
jgi:hypothetical protein